MKAHMHQDVLRAIENGATIITAGKRLARVLVREFHAALGVRGPPTPLRGA